MIKAIAIDDEPPALKLIQEFCKKIDFIHLQKIFTRPAEVLKYLHKFPADLIFLDIQMPSISGIQFSRMLPQNTMIIFTTAHYQYAVEGFNLCAIDYLLKPFTFERFLQAVKKANAYFKFFHQNEDAKNQFLIVRADYSLVKIAINEILYIEGLDDYLKIHIHNHKTIVIRMTMKALLEKLPDKDFVRVHRSFIIPVNKIKSIRNKTISIEEAEIPIGLSYEENFFSHFKK